MKKTTSELKDKSIGELEKEAEDLRTEIAKLRLELRVNPSKDTNILMKKRRSLAIILTHLAEKKEIEKFNPD